MAAGQGLNTQWFRYVGAGATNWAMRVDALWGATAGAGFAAFNSADPVWPKSKRWVARAVIGVDPVSGRKTRMPIGSGTATIYALGQTFTRFVRGLQTTVTFTVVKLIGEKRPSSNPKINSFPEYVEPT